MANRPGRDGGEEAPLFASHWNIWVDTGGTFTDCLAVDPAGDVERCKVLSSGRVRAVAASNAGSEAVALDVDWDLPGDFFRGARLSPLGFTDPSWEISGYRSPERSVQVARGVMLKIEKGQPLEIDTRLEAPILAAHWVTRTPLEAPLPPTTMRLATTRGTNALLERAGSPTVLFITAGFGDLLEIGNQQRPDLFALNVIKSMPLFETTIEVLERLDSAGEVLRPLDLTALRPSAEAVLARGVTAAAVALLHSYRNPRHEEELADFLADLGFDHVSCSSHLAPLIKIVPRAETAVINAYLSGVIGEYLDTVGRSIGSGPLHVLTSAGSLVRSARYLPKDSLLSGPAGGVVGAAAMASQSGWPRSLAFDMGGTSTDVSRFDREFDYRFETVVGDARLLSPSLAIETVAAGGGSICHFDGTRLKVGPQSSGADPGPACYGAGGPLTLTDVNLLLGRLRPEGFEIPIDPSAAALAAERLLRQLGSDGNAAPGLDEMLQGLLEIANERMAEAVRRISIRQGYRPKEFALVAFGGAGGQHACALAEILDMSTVLIPEDAGLLSAAGLGWARIERIAERQVLRPLGELEDALAGLLDEVAAEACDAVRFEGIAMSDIEVERRLVYLRLTGQEASLGIDFDSMFSLAAQFAKTYEDHYGYRPENAPIEIETLRVVATSGERFESASAPTPRSRSVESSERQDAHLGGRWSPIPVFTRDALRVGDRLLGPALVFERHCSTVIHPGWSGKIDGNRCLTLERREGELVDEP